MLLTPPLAFARVDAGIYRSAYPTKKSLQYILDNLFLKSLVCLCPNELRSDVRDFALNNSIEIREYNIGFNQEPFISMFEEPVRKAIDFIADETNHPVLIFCLTGQKKTSCLIGCYRRSLNWSLASVLHEYELHNDPEGILSDMIFIENFSWKTVNKGFGGMIIYSNFLSHRKIGRLLRNSSISFQPLLHSYFYCDWRSEDRAFEFHVWKLRHSQPKLVLRS